VEWPKGVQTSLALDRGFAEIADIPQDELPRLLEVHFAPLAEHGKAISESCPLIGGLVLEVDSRRLIYPQCCGDLSDVASWIEPIHSDSGRGFVANAGHPAPEIIREGDKVRVVCFDPNEPFFPTVDRDVVVPATALESAVRLALEQLAELARRLDQLDEIADHPGLARVLAGRTS